METATLKPLDVALRHTFETFYSMQSLTTVMTDYCAMMLESANGNVIYSHKEFIQVLQNMENRLCESRSRLENITSA